MFFKHKEGDVAILVRDGVYRQCDLYVRNGYLFAKVGPAGFVRLMADGSTSKPGVRLETLAIEGELYRDTLGRLADQRVAGARVLAPAESQKLIGVANG